MASKSIQPVAGHERPTWRATVPDPFAHYYRPVRAAKHYRIWVAILASGLGLQALVMAAWLLKPASIVVLPSGGPTAPWLQGPNSLTAPTSTQAEAFLSHMMGLRYGWRSYQVREHMGAYLSLAHPTHQQAFETVLETPIARHPSARTQPRMRTWQEANLRHVVAALDGPGDLTCAPGDRPGLWLCQCQAQIFTHLISPDGDESTTSRTLDVLALILQTRHTPTNPWGFLLLDLTEQAAPASHDERSQ
jgi:hypothetical protein